MSDWKNVRRVRKTPDLEWVAKLNNQLIGEPLSPSQLREAHWWFSTYGGFLSGFCGLLARPEAEWAYLIRSAVLPEWRGRGIQRDHIRARVRYTKRYIPGVKKLITYTLFDNHASSNNLAQCGFKLYTPEEAWSEVGDALYWMLEL